MLLLFILLLLLLFVVRLLYEISLNENNAYIDFLVDIYIDYTYIFDNDIMLYFVIGCVYVLSSIL